MLFRSIAPSLILFSLLFQVGCVQTKKYNEFTSTINFSTLDTYVIRDVLTTGPGAKPYEVEQLNMLSREYLHAALAARDFSESDSGTDFYWVVEWNKSSSFNPNFIDSVNSFQTELRKSDDPGGNIAIRWHLTLSAYEFESGERFWQKKLPNLFEALEFNEWRIQESIERAIKNFPERVEKDPNLPMIE